MAIIVYRNYIYRVLLYHRKKGKYWKRVKALAFQTLMNASLLNGDPTHQIRKERVMQNLTLHQNEGVSY